MKKRMLVCLSAFAFISNMLCFWYADTLINKYFVFGLIPIGLALLALIVSVIISLILIIRRRGGLACVCSLLISLVTIVMIFVFPFRMAKVRTEFALLEKERMEVVELVIDGDIVVDTNGSAKLPDEYNMTSSDGYIFVYQNDDEQVISFWVFRGLLSGSVELIYSSQNESLIYKNEIGHSITNIVQLKEHWYLVDTEY